MGICLVDELKRNCQGSAAPRSNVHAFSGLRRAGFHKLGSYFLGNGLIDVQSDLFYVNGKHLLQPETLRQRSVSNLLSAIEASKGRPLARVLVALGIRHVGGEVAELLAREFTTIDNLMAADEEALIAIDSIGPRIAESVVSYFQNDANRQVVEKLRVAGVRLEASAPVLTEHPSPGKHSWLGRWSGHRSQVQDLIKRTAVLSAAAEQNTSYLVAARAAARTGDAQRPKSMC